MRQVTKVLLALLGILVTLGTVAVLAAVFLFSSERGLQWAYRIAAAAVPGQLSVEQLHGRLAGPFTVQGLHYRNQSTDLDVQRLTLDWRPGDLVRARLSIHDLEAGGINLQRTPSAQGGGNGRLPDIHLPVGVNIDHATLGDLNLDGTRIDHLEIAGARVHDDTLHVQHLALTAPSFQLSLSGQLSPNGDYPLNAHVQWSAQGGQYGPLQGEAQLDGDLKKLHVRQRLTAPVEVTLQADLSDLLGDLGWQGELTVPTVNLQRLQKSWPDLTMGGTVQGRGDLRRVQRLEGQLRTVYSGLHAQHRFTASFEDATLHVERLASTLAETDTALKVHGTVNNLTDTPRANLAGSWQDLRWPLTGAATVRSAKGTFTLDGDLSRYRLQSQGGLAGPQLPDADWTLNGHGTQQGFTVTTLQVRTLGGALTAEGEAHWQPRLRWEAAVQGEALNPGVQWPDWPGRLDLAARSHGSVQEGVLQTHVALTSLKGRLRSFHVAANGVLDVNGNRYTIAGLQLNSDGSRLTADGTVSDSWDLQWQLQAPRLDRLIPRGGGRLQGKGAVSGPRKRPRVTATLNGGQLNFAGYHLGRLAADLSLNLQQQAASRIEVKLSDITAGQLRVDAVALQGKGSIAAHQVTLDVSGGNSTLSLQVSGRYGQSRWNGTVEALRAALPLAGRWHLAEPVSVSVNDGSAAQLGTLCLLHDQSRACAQGRWAAARGWQAQAALHAIPLERFQPWLPRDVTLTGSLTADARAAADAQGLITGGAEVRLKAAMIPPGGKPQQAALRQHPTELILTLDQQALALRLQSDLAGGGNLQGHLNIKRAALPAPVGAGKLGLDPSLSGQLGGEVTDLRLLPAFIPGIEHTRGRLSTTLHIAGSPEHPRITGEMRLDNGSALIPALGIKPQAINAVIHGDERGRLHLEASLQSEGTLRITGDARLNQSRGVVAQAKLSGDRVEVMRTPEFQVTASPDMQLNVKGRHIEVNGGILIPAANLRPRDVSGAVSPSNDVVIVSKETPAAQKSRWQIYSQVRVRLGDFVKFNGFGLKGLLTGDLTLSEAPQQPTVARGELSINDGEYKVYGQKLSVDRGQLLFFGGPVDNPGLDIRAVRHIQEVTAGIVVRGTLKAPQVQIFSEPAMSEADALSYLVLGRPINQATTSQGQQLYGAALSLGLAGGSLLANQIGQRFGIDELTVESGGSFGGGALVLRHYLSPKLYISYGVGLVEHFNVFHLRYQISELWSLDAESGAHSGADLVYTLERD